MKALKGLLFLSTTATALINTPCGKRLKECVREAPQQSIITFSSSNEAHDFNILHHNGTIEKYTVPQSCHDYFNTLAPKKQPLQQKTPNLPTSSTVPNGWIESAGVYRMDPTNTIHSFDASWTVPSKPKSPQRPETLYYFIGLEDRTQGKFTTIHQPVLTWGDQTEGGLYSNEWHLWSWTCCPKNLTWHSPDIAGFQPGDTIYGEITKIDAETWKINGGWKESNGTWHNTTLLSQVGGYNYNYADVTLEVYNITDCEQMSNGDVLFEDLHLTTDHGTKEWDPPMWYVSGFPSSCHTTLKMNNSNHSMIISSE